MSIRVLRILFVLGLVAVLLTSSDALAQRGGGRGGARGGFGGFGGGTNPVAFIQRDDVKEEIKLTSSQLTKIEALAEDGQGRGRRGFGDFGNFRDMSAEERAEALTRIREQQQEQQQEQREKVHAILNPDQQKRVKELEFQYALQQGRLESALAVADVDVAAGDRQELREAQQEAMEKVREQIAKIQLEANAAALAKVLDTTKVEELMGKAFTFEQERPRITGRRGGPGGFGRGRGGDGGRPERPGRPGRDSDSNPRRNR